jgi:penicillin amidase
MRSSLNMLGRHLKAWIFIAGLVLTAYALYLASGWLVAAATQGTQRGLTVREPVEILRDQRDVPHVRARNCRDVFFAQGYAEGSDRLFQMELLRRLAYGRLSEIFGPRTLQIDEAVRAFDASHVVDREWGHAGPGERAVLQALSDGVNAAVHTQPLPLEFRALLYRPSPWHPRDSLAVALVITADLSDSWYDVLARDDLWRRSSPRDFDAYLPLSDARYDVPTVGTITRPRPASTYRAKQFAFARPLRGVSLGSNTWAVGGARTASGRALLANDPHLELTIPGPWYLVDLACPGLHVAGASIPGIPGVMLGHNDRIAWGTSNATVTDASVFEVPRPDRRMRVRERFHIRFGSDVVRDYYRTSREFSIAESSGDGSVDLVRWRPYAEADSSVAAMLALDAAPTLGVAMRALSTYSDPAQNFVLADSIGRVAYHLAGKIPADPAWGRYVHPASDLRRSFAPIPFDRLPSQSPSRRATLVSANNRMYGDGYPYRLTAAFAPPYRAYRIAQLLHAARVPSAGYFEQMQLDTQSPVDLEFARQIVAYARTRPDALPREMVQMLTTWDGRFVPASKAATLEHALRSTAQSDDALFPGFMQRLREGRTTPFEWNPLELIWTTLDDPQATRAWERAGSVGVDNPLGLWFLDGGTLPGDGDEYTIHVQTSGFAQSFRAVWDVGNWDAGGIVIPSGESGEPGSGHYTDQLADWIAGKMTPLPFSDAAVARATRATLTLEP